MPPSNMSLTDEQLLLYSRQIMLPQIDVKGQQKLLDANVLVLGAGGLGCPALLYLTACGVGSIQVVDNDIIERSNIQRQIIYQLSDIGRSKAEVACERMRLLNNDAKINAINKLPDDEKLLAMVEQADVVLDGTDNFSSRYRHNRACVQTHTPLVSGAVIRFEGQVTTFDNKLPSGPCYHCLYPEGVDEEQNCSENGVLGPVAGMVASVMATETIKTVVSIGASLNGRLLLLDALQMEWRTVRYTQDANCPVCAVASSSNARSY